MLKADEGVPRLGDEVPVGKLPPVPPRGTMWSPGLSGKVWVLVPIEGQEKMRVAAAARDEQTHVADRHLEMSGGASSRSPEGGPERGEIEVVMLQLEAEQRILGEAVRALEVALAQVVVPLLDHLVSDQAQLAGVAEPPVTQLGQRLGDRVVGMQELAQQVRDLAARVAL